MNSAHSYRTLLADLAIIVLAAALLVKPLFQAQYLERWDSIESTFIADGRFLHEHWPHPQWQPLWYCGTRYDYIYPPVLRYGVAVLASASTPAHAYHLFIAVLYCCGIAGVYFLAWVMNGSRAAAWLAAAGVALVSPAFLLIRAARWDSLHHTPWRLWVLLRYGEGPHISALSLLGFALAFSWPALRRYQPAAMAAAALFSALVALTNFYGATALAMFYVAMVWAVWVTSGDNRVWLRAAAIPTLACGLSAFWLTPSYLRITMQNLHWVSAPGKTWPAAVPLALVLAFGLVSMRISSGRPLHAYGLFLAGSLLLFGFDVLGRYYLQRHAIGDPWRLIPELDLILILAGVEVLRRFWNIRASRALVIVVILASLWSARHYVKRAWGDYLYPPSTDFRQRVEYRMSDWIGVHFPEARTFVTGSNRLWWDTWRDLAQVGGGSDQGQLNPHLPDAQWNLIIDSNSETAVQWLTALGADVVIVPFPQSQEIYREFHFPQKFSGVLPVIYDDRKGNVIYQVPRRYPWPARVVDRTRLASLRPLPLGSTSIGALRAYTTLLEQGPDAPAATAWDGTDRLRIHARFQQNQSLIVQVSYDPAWHAYLGSKVLPVRPDPLAFTIIDAPAGEHDIRLVFETPLENQVGWVVTGLSLVIVAALAIYGR